ncbi:hypothetical protein D3C80_1709490 [compost metagenome]
MELARPGGVALQGPLGPDKDRNVLAPGDLAQDTRIPRRLFGADIAPDRGHGQQVKIGRGEGGQQPRGVIHAGVAINDERLFHPADVPRDDARGNHRVIS